MSPIHCLPIIHHYGTSFHEAVFLLNACVFSEVLFNLKNYKDNPGHEEGGNPEEAEAEGEQDFDAGTRPSDMPNSPPPEYNMNGPIGKYCYFSYNNSSSSNNLSRTTLPRNREVKKYALHELVMS